jgi:glutaredoxin-like YruB-family protein
MITIYSTPTCPWCHKAKDYLDSKNVEYEDVDVSENTERAHEMVKKSGQMGVPVLDINGKILVGFNPMEIDEALV